MHVTGALDWEWIVGIYKIKKATMKVSVTLKGYISNRNRTKRCYYVFHIHSLSLTLQKKNVKTMQRYGISDIPIIIEKTLSMYQNRRLGEKQKLNLEIPIISCTEL